MESLSFGARVWLAFILPFRVLLDGRFAGKVRGLDGPSVTKLPKPKPAEVTAQADPDNTTALQLMSIMQREGRFIDFLQEDVSTFSDADVGAAARVVHEGCKRGLREYIEFAPIRSEAEGDAVELPVGFDAAQVRVTGNVVGDPPFKGTLAHHGWKVQKIEMPIVARGHDPRVVAPAEVEL